MKKSLITTALLGFASAAISVSTANAATISATAGDVVLGFYATSGSGTATSVMVDLGSATQFDNATPGQIIPLTGPSLLATTDLSNTYGSGWATDSGPELGCRGHEPRNDLPRCGTLHPLGQRTGDTRRDAEHTVCCASKGLPTRAIEPYRVHVHPSQWSNIDREQLGNFTRADFDGEQLLWRGHPKWPRCKLWVFQSGD